MSSDYLKEAVKEALNDEGVHATPLQIEGIAESIEISMENYSMATGLDVAIGNYESEESRELKRIKEDMETHSLWVSSTEPCKDCMTTGEVLDRWGRDARCDACFGKGRV